MSEKIKISDNYGAVLIAKAGMTEALSIHGVFKVECRDKNGKLKWSDEFHNTVVTVGKNIMLNTLFVGAAYTVTGPFMGLISSTSFTSIAAADTMASHAGWLEAGSANAPTYSGNRATLAFGGASGGVISLSASAAFAITGTGTVKGGFVCLGTGAVNTKDNTSGTLFSAGLFTGGDRAVINGDTLNVSYSVTLT